MRYAERPVRTTRNDVRSAGRFFIGIGGAALYAGRGVASRAHLQHANSSLEASSKRRPLVRKRTLPAYTFLLCNLDRYTRWFCILSTLTGQDTFLSSSRSVELSRTKYIF